jgi:phospholipase C
MKIDACAVLAIAALAGCGQNLAPAGGVGRSTPTAAALYGTSPSSKIQHVVIIFQENRSVDNLFNGLRGADTVRSGKNSQGKTVVLRPGPLAGNYDLGHTHGSFEVEYANGELDGFNRDNSTCKRSKTCPPTSVRAYAYVPQSEVKPYFELAEQYTFADRMFESNEGPSFPAHQYILSGTSTSTNGSQLRASSNAFAPDRGFTGGCDSPLGSTVWLIDPVGRENQAMYPCFQRLSLIDLIESKSLSWRYYVNHVGPGTWNGPDAIQNVRDSAEYSSDVIAPPSRVISDIGDGRLANVVWVTPTAAESDHPSLNKGLGPSWVASVVNAVGESKYWADTAIFITWDDWGGWYDHVKPLQYNSYELGFRVPLIVVSPYAKAHYVSHLQHEFGSILKFVEETFHLGSLHTTDVRADDLSDCFDFSQRPIQFKPIPSEFGAEYFLRQPLLPEDPQDY